MKRKFREPYLQAIYEHMYRFWPQRPGKGPHVEMGIEIMRMSFWAGFRDEEPLYPLYADTCAQAAYCAGYDTAPTRRKSYAQRQR